MKKDKTSCSSASPPVPHSPAASRPSSSLPATASTTPPSSSGSWPSTLATTDSSWSSTHQTLRLLQNRFVASSAKKTVFMFLKFMRFRRQLCACHQALGAQHTTWPAWTPPSLARAGWSRPASPSTSSTSCLPFSLSSLFLSSFSIVVAGACALLVPGGCQSVELYPPTTSPGSPKNSQRRRSGTLEGISAHLLPPRHLFLPQTLLDRGFTVCRQD